MEALTDAVHAVLVHRVSDDDHVVAVVVGVQPVEVVVVDLVVPDHSSVVPPRVVSKPLPDADKQGVAPKSR